MQGGRIRTVFVGLDYAGARVAWDGLRLSLSADDWPRLAAIEEAARDALNEAAT